MRKVKQLEARLRKVKNLFYEFKLLEVNLRKGGYVDLDSMNKQFDYIITQSNKMERKNKEYTMDELIVILKRRVLKEAIQ